MRNKQIFEEVFMQYLNFLNGVQDTASSFAKKKEISIGDGSRQTSLMLRLISDREGEADKVAGCISSMVIGHKVSMDTTGTIRQAAVELNQISNTDLGINKKIYVIMTEENELSSLPEKMQTLCADLNALCVVRVRGKINGSWQIPEEGIKALLKINHCFQNGVYFVLEDLCRIRDNGENEDAETAYAKTVAALLITISQVFDRYKNDFPLPPGKLTGKPNDENIISVVSVASVNVCRIGVLLACVDRLMNKQDSRDKSGQIEEDNRTVDDICHIDEFCQTIENVYYQIISKVNEEALLADLASMPLSSSCEDNLRKAQNEANRFLSRVFSFRKEPHNITLQEILGVTSNDTRYEDYYREKAERVWEKAVEQWFSDDRNIYCLFRDMINCFVDLESACSDYKRWKDAVDEVAKNHEFSINQENIKELYNREHDLREVAEHYIKSRFVRLLTEKKREIFFQVIEKIKSNEMWDEWFDVISVLMNLTRQVSNKIWDEYREEICGLLGHVYYPKSYDFFIDDTTDKMLLSVPNVPRFRQNGEKLTVLRDELSREDDRKICNITTGFCSLNPSGDWIIKDDNDEEKSVTFSNGQICFVIRRSKSHRFYGVFDDQRVTRVRINTYNLNENDAIKRYISNQEEN